MHAGSRFHRRGFTLVEVFAVVALLGIVLSLGVLRYDRMVEAMQRRPVEDIATHAVRIAHLAARERQQPVYLSYRKETGALVLTLPSGFVVREFPFRPESEDGGEGIEVRFYRVKPEERLSGAMAFEREDIPVDYIIFHPSGATPPFALFIEEGLRAKSMYYDPFSSSLTEGGDGDV